MSNSENAVSIKIRRENIEITNLETGLSSSCHSINSFSSVRNVVSNFNNAHETIRRALMDLGIKQTLLSRPLNILMQQLEGTEGGLSDLEKRALRDLGELVGGKKIFIVEHSNSLTTPEALATLGK